VSNNRLAVRSETFYDDFDVLIDKRCFLLAIGDDDQADNAVSMSGSVNVFDSPRKDKKIDIRIR